MTDMIDDELIADMDREYDDVREQPTPNNATDGQSRAGEAGANLTAVLACRLCGETPLVGGVFFMGHHVECGKCGITVPFPPAKSREAAISAWNIEQANAKLTDS